MQSGLNGRNVFDQDTHLVVQKQEEKAERHSIWEESPLGNYDGKKKISFSFSFKKVYVEQGP